MNKKRILSLLLAIVMVISLVPTYVFATEGEPTDPTVTEPVVTEPVVTEPVVTEPVVTESVVTEPAAPVGVECEVCGAPDCTSTHETWCDVCKKDDCGQTHTTCDKCGTVNCQSTHEYWCDVCKKDDCGQTHTACDKCGTVDCQSTHENWCEICKVDTCGKTHAACDKCGTVDCQSTHENWCEICKKDDCGQTHTPGNAENPSEPSQPSEEETEPSEPAEPEKSAVTAFIDFITGFPVEKILEYKKAREEYDLAWGKIPVDSDEIPYEEQIKLNVAEEELKGALALYDNEMKIDDLDSNVNDLLRDMVFGYYDAMDVEEDIDAYLEEKLPGMVGNITKLMEYVDFGIEMYAIGKQAVGISTPNIKVSLFNYGKKINEATNKVLGFTFPGQYDVDTDGTDDGSAHVYPKLGDSVNGYPYIAGWLGNATTKDGTGSLQYLFDKNSDYISGNGGNQSYIANNSNYQFKQFAVSDLRLFQYNAQTGQYTYNSAYNAAEYNNGSLIAYNYALRPFYASDNGEANLQGHFLPFNNQSQGVQIVDENGNKLTNNLQTGMTGLNDTNFANYELSSKASNLYALRGSEATRADMAFGMSVEFDFNMPEGGKVNGNDMVFDFMGDDDVVIYVDGKPVLNIGGGHAATKGTINFSTGEVSVYQMGSKSIKVTDGRCTTLKEIFGLDGNTFEDFTTHTLQFFYLERFGTNANCWLEFNLEPIPTNDVTITKQVEGINPELIELDDQTYTFTLSAIDRNNNPVNDIAYGTSRGNDGLISHGGTIELKAGETATLEKLPAGTEIKFTEHANNDKFIIDSWTCEGDTYTPGAGIELPNSSNALDFVCKNVRIVSTLTIEKEMAGDDYHTGDEYEISVHFNDTAYTGKALKTDADGNTTEITFVNGKQIIEADESILIKQIPVGMEYSVIETDPEDTILYKYDAPAYENESGTVNAPVTTIITNTIHLLYGNLTIAKQGIQNVDHHEANANNGEETQATLYTISGTSYSGEEVNLKVAIVGNSSVAIKDIPVGKYTVTEDTDWSWRYDTTNNGREIEIVGGKTSETTFVNTRTEIYWLSGDSYCENWWGGENGTVVRKDEA